MNTRSLGIVAALRGEARQLGGVKARSGSHIQLDDAVTLQVSGIGQANARTAAKTLISKGANALVSWGFAGALVPGLRPGTIFLPTLITDAQNNMLPVDTAWHDRLQHKLSDTPRMAVQSGALFTSSTTIDTPADKRRFHQASGAMAVDMESAAIASVAAESGVPFMAIRSISDAANAALPSTALALIDTQGRLQLRRGLLHWLAHPQQTPSMLRLVMDTNRAGQALRSVADLTGNTLLAPTLADTDRQARVSCRY